MATVANMGLHMGSMILKKMVMVPAPSILAACCNSFGVDSTNVLTRMMKKRRDDRRQNIGQKIVGQSASDLMVKYHGIIPALKNIVKP